MAGDKQPGITILVVDDDKVHRYTLCSLIRTWGWSTAEADDGTTAVAAVGRQRYDAVLMDVRMARMDGHEAFRRIHELQPTLPVIIMTAYSSVEDAVEAMRQGATIISPSPLISTGCAWPCSGRWIISRSASKRQPPGCAASLDTAIIGSSPPMLELLEMIGYVAPTEATVLITGESGTGKELVAEALHRNSGRRGRPFVKVNCAALAEGLLESELFGHEKGAFTGADKRREGKFVQADGGTLFLDEIGETSQAMQVKLLRVLQEQELQRVGGEATIKVDVRIIAATNRDLEEEVRRGAFREDLYYRLNVVMLTVPPLRARSNDIAMLVDHFAQKFAEKNRRVLDRITEECRQLLLDYPWPGNVRELENAIERGIILMRGSELTEKSLPLTVQNHGERRQQAKSGAETEPGSLFDVEKQAILKTLEETGGNKSEAARRLGITRKTLQNKLNRYQAG
jgi:two-component system, NtrC family, response regulator HydG